MDCDRLLIKLLIEAGLVDRDLDPAIYCSPSAQPIKTLAQKKLLEEESAIKQIAGRLGIEHLDLFSDHTRRKFTIERYLPKVSSDLCYVHKAIPLFEEPNATVVAFANPLDIDAQKQLKFVLQNSVRVVIAEEDQIIALLSKNYPSPLAAFDGPEKDNNEDKLELVTSEQHDDCDLDEKTEDVAPVIKLINHILAEAVRLRASDIHFDATPNGLDVRCRIDGEMQHLMDTPKRFQRPVVSRIKLLSGMNIAEKRAPQDGRFRIKFEGKLIDLRVSCIPTAYGEKIVIRILRSDFDHLSFELLGMPSNIRSRLEKDLKLPGKMILVTGPTGSGKTTTLYAALKFLTDGTSNIETVEDPIEYKVPGVNQIQINEAAGLTFASCLRSILRQDPDIIMVGEIRDSETAHIALQAAQTGHLVISTLHTNDAPSAVTRLLNLDCDPFILSSSLAGVMAQRLIRRICPHCISSLPLDNSSEDLKLMEHFNISPSDLKNGIGCEKCRYTGYFGRIGIYSYFHMTSAIGSLIHTRAPMQEILAEAKRSGFVELHEVALNHLRDGVTSFSEVKPFLASQPQADSNVTTLPKCINPTAIKKMPSSRQTIMLVEDDPLSRTNIAQHLRNCHFRVVEFENGIAALKQLKETVPNIIVTGLGLPGIDGKQLLRLARQEQGVEKVPIVIITSADSDENEAELLKLGADDFISRSRSPEVFIERIKRIAHSASTLEPDHGDSV